MLHYNGFLYEVSINMAVIKHESEQRDRGEATSPVADFRANVVAGATGTASSSRTTLKQAHTWFASNPDFQMPAENSAVAEEEGDWQLV